MEISKNFKKWAKKMSAPNRVIVFGFAGVLLLGAFLLCLPISNREMKWFPFIDALFTATSAICVTGLIVVDTAIHFNWFGQLVILLLIQIGGLGIMTGATMIFIMIGRKITLRSRLLLQETLSENRLQGMIKLIKKIILFTIAIELLGAIILMFTFIPRYGAKGIFTSIFLSISAYCNAGFDIVGRYEGAFSSLTPFATDLLVCLPIMALIVIGGLGFAVISDLATFRKKHKLSLHAKIALITTFLLVIFGWIFYAVAEWNNLLAQYTTAQKIFVSLFQSITPRTAGFNTINQSTLTPVSYMMTIILMFIGASPASTGGGIKTTTVAIMMIVAFRTLRGERSVNLDKSKISVDTMRKVISIFAIAFLFIGIGTLTILLSERNNPIVNFENVLFEVVSAFSTVGLSMGITPHLGVVSKLILGLTMFAGRIGPLTLGASLVKNKETQKIEYTDARILIG